MKAKEVGIAIAVTTMQPCIHKCDQQLITSSQRATVAQVNAHRGGGSGETRDGLTKTPRSGSQRK
jgi:hypothetical protein